MGFRGIVFGNTSLGTKNGSFVFSSIAWKIVISWKMSHKYVVVRVPGLAGL